MSVLQKKNRDYNSSFTVRKISFGEGVERTFALYSTIISSIKVIRSGQVRRAKLYYLRDRKGKSARITEKIKKSIGVDVSEQIIAEETENKNVSLENEKNIEPKKEAPKAAAPKTEPKKEALKEKKLKKELQKEKK